jgi:hypothetical protein
MASATIIEFPGDERVGAIGFDWPAQSERRIKLRYPSDLTVGFRCPEAGSLVSGEGLAVNLSSSGVLVASQHHQMKVGDLVELSIEWPLLLDGRTPLQLLALGRVVRCGVFHFAAAFERHEFRTMRTPVSTT